VSTYEDKVAKLQADEQRLYDWMGELANDPLAFVLEAWDWGHGRLEPYPDGPDSWQVDYLKDMRREIRQRNFNGKDPVLPIMTATATGHGVGKSALNAWIANFIMGTRPFARGIQTANTATQLETKTWPELMRWTEQCVTAHWWKITSGRGAMKMQHRANPQTWRLDGVAWQENRAEAFAGLHAATSSPFFLCDEASATPKIILETAEGGLTDGEPFLILWGNPTQSSGYFYEAFRKRRHRFITRKVDSRTARMTNKTLIEQWIEDYGLDSDFVKVRVRGEFPSQSATQFMPTDIVEAAQKEQTQYEPFPEDPIIIGVDVARGGDDESVIAIRQGRSSRHIPWLTFRGLRTTQLAAHVAELAHRLRPDAICVDGSGVGGGVVDRLLQLQIPRVFEVNFGGKSPDRKYRNMGTFMWGEARDALTAGHALPVDDELKQQLVAREYYFDQNNAYMLESKDDLKARGEPSPDRADAWVLTYAVRPGPRDPVATMAQLAGHGAEVNDWDYNPLGER